MKAISFNDNWFYRPLDSDSEAIPVIIPHDAMLSEPRSENSAGGKNTGWFRGRDYLYSKDFTLDPALNGQHIWLEFEGVYRNAEVWLNGVKLSHRPYGYTNFYVDCSRWIYFDRKNHIEVMARNADQPNSRWYTGAGIYRPVKLWIAGKEHIRLNGVKVRTISTSVPTVEISILTKGIGPVIVYILSNDQIIAQRKDYSNGSTKLVMEIPDAQLWSPDSPTLYTCRVHFADDEENVNFGFRSITWGKEGFKINDRRVVLRGACIHHDNGILGACCFPEAEERKVRLLKEGGYNAIRSAHNPCSKALLDACDRLGMLVLDEYADSWYIHKTRYDYASDLLDWWQQDLTDLVDKDYNHPSVVMYSIGNEVSETAQLKGIVLTTEMTQYLHELDCTRPVTCGINMFFNFLSAMGLGVYSERKAQQNKKQVVGSQFFNKLAGMLGAHVMKLGATLWGCDITSREALAQLDIAGYNYGIMRYKHDLRKYPDRLILGTETFCCDTSAFWDLAQNEPRIIGDFVWTGIDYLGEVGLGAWEYSDYAPEFNHGPGWISSGCGRLDLTGKPLGEAAYTKVAFGEEIGPRISVRPVNHTNERHSPSAWKMTSAIESWSWQGCEGKTAIVEVYAHADFVELILNRKHVGRKKVKNCRASFRISYENGVLTAIAYDTANQIIGRNSIVSAGRETCLKVSPEQECVRHGGLCFARLQYTDAKGIVKPLERGRLKVTVSGGRLLALGNGCPYYNESYFDTETDTYFGEALAIILADQKQSISIYCTDGNQSAASTIKLLNT